MFYALQELSPDDEIRVHGRDGDVARFHVRKVQQRDKDTFPTEQVYGDTRQPALRLITCGGPFNDARDRYEDNIIVYAE